VFQLATLFVSHRIQSPSSDIPHSGSFLHPQLRLQSPHSDHSRCTPYFRRLGSAILPQMLTNFKAFSKCETRFILRGRTSRQRCMQIKTGCLCASRPGVVSTGMNRWASPVICINASSILRKRYRECTCVGGLSHALLGILPRPLDGCVVVCNISERDDTSRVCRSSGVSRAIHGIKAES
jgi:hypothetical protein